MQTNNSKEKVRQLQNKLYLTAKKCSGRRFHALNDKVYRDELKRLEQKNGETKRIVSPESSIGLSI